MQNSPIGIFDSGIGGLTIAYSLKKILPNESFIYFGDTKHLPYGEKSEKAIKHYSLKIALFLKSKNHLFRSFGRDGFLVFMNTIFLLIRRNLVLSSIHH